MLLKYLKTVNTEKCTHKNITRAVRDDSTTYNTLGHHIIKCREENDIGVVIDETFMQKMNKANLICVALRRTFKNLNAEIFFLL